MALLCGGTSQRMGLPKEGLVNGAGQTLLDYQLSRLTPHFEHSMILSGCKSAEQLSTSFAPLPPVYQDPEEWANCGPLVGLLVALDKTPTPWLTLVAVDQPNYPPRLALEATRSSSLVVFEDTSGRLQWLGGLFHRRLRAAIEESLRNGTRAFRGFLDNFEDVTIVPGQDQGSFLNINTPMEARAAGFSPRG